VNKISYENTDKKIVIDIYGIEFEIKKLRKEILEDLQKLKEEETEDFESLYKYVDLFLGDGASEKINAQRKKDGYEPMNYEVILKIIDMVIGAYKDQYNELMNYNNKFNNYNKQFGNRAYRRRRY
jgi:hypothetical protein